MSYLVYQTLFNNFPLFLNVRILYPNSMRSQHKNPRLLAQDILSRRDHSEAEVRQKLTRKHLSPDTIDDTIAWLKSKKYVNDAQFAATYIEQTTNLKPVGPRWLQAKLRQKGVDPDTIQQALQDHYPQQKDLARQAADRWRKSHPTKADDTTKLYRHLASRGFSTYIIREVLT